jgi:hypothetical protein
VQFRCSIIGPSPQLTYYNARALVESDQSPAARVGVTRRHSGPGVDLPKAQKSFHDAIATAKRAAGCAVAASETSEPASTCSLRASASFLTRWSPR